MCEDRVANVFCRLISMVTNYPFKLNAVLLIAAIVDPVCIKEENVSWTHERDFCHVRRVHFARSRRHGKIPVPVWIVLRNRQPQREEPHHASLADLHELFVFRGKY